jgi:hypothetical protein
LTVTVLFLWAALSDERTGLSCVSAAGLASTVFLGSESLGTRDHIYCLIFETSLFVASNDSQGHGETSDLRLDYLYTRSLEAGP